MAERPRTALGRPPAGVAERLAKLRVLYVPEGAAQARRRLADPGPAQPDLSAASVSRRLAELRALCELAGYLHRPR